MQAEKRKRFSLDPRDIMKDLGYDCPPQRTERKAECRQSQHGYAESILKAAGIAAVQAPNGNHSSVLGIRPVPGRARQAPSRARSTVKKFIDLTSQMESMDDTAFLLLCVQASKEFEKRYGVTGWCDRVYIAAEVESFNGAARTGACGEEEV